MNKLNKFLVIGAASLAVLGFVGTATVLAGNGTGDSGDFSPMVARLAEKSDLYRSQVQAELEDFRAQRQAERHEEMEARFEERLEQALEEGKITEDQKEDILAKHEGIEEKVQETKDLGREKGREKMSQIRDEMQTWMEQQGIDMSLFGSFGRRDFGPKDGFKSGRRFGPRSGDCPMAE